MFWKKEVDETDIRSDLKLVVLITIVRHVLFVNHGC